MKNQKFLSIAAALAVLAPLSAQAAPTGGLFTVGGNAPTSSAPVSGILGSGATPGTKASASFAPEIQARVNAAGAGINAESISGNQSVGGGSVSVDPAAAAALIAVINSPAGSNGAVPGLVTALGGGDSAQTLANSLTGLRSGNGSIDPVVLSAAVTAYNTYLSGVVAQSKVTERNASDLEAVLQAMPGGQKAVQVLLSKLLAG
jgi:hypothetical protein